MTLVITVPTWQHRRAANDAGPHAGEPHFTWRWSAAAARPLLVAAAAAAAAGVVAGRRRRRGRGRLPAPNALPRHLLGASHHCRSRGNEQKHALRHRLSSLDAWQQVAGWLAVWRVWRLRSLPPPAAMHGCTQARLHSRRVPPQCNYAPHQTSEGAAGKRWGLDRAAAFVEPSPATRKADADKQAGDSRASADWSRAREGRNRRRQAQHGTAASPGGRRGRLLAAPGRGNQPLLHPVERDSLEHTLRHTAYWAVVLSKQANQIATKAGMNHSEENKAVPKRNKWMAVDGIPSWNNQMASQQCHRARTSALRGASLQAPAQRQHKASERGARAGRQLARAGTRAWATRQATPCNQATKQGGGTGVLEGG